ncbi:deoxyribose-phosphate aldolase [Anaerobranca gottschalkii]|uniref:Deoxyribose-phosphate aldolase n=1 Tax=Anaerobranca gottschalkii DSM 13577 TaxID=1120990 RepID=A0A1H9ZK78_9FIRM|nr:deoxyribose-phosphate aldolase [Anaerobranca gottschalkii]SES82027.1 deoxyribose-phosphate aldolase [Anaerobranca gottschalkii DSM 13577]
MEKHFDKNLASMIDHTLLKAQAAKEEIIKLCQEAREYGFATVCVNPCYIELAKKELTGSNVGITTVIGFPLGASTTEVKRFETKDALDKGATEIDMVLNVGMMKSGDYDYVLNDIKAVVEEAKGRGIVKVILETCYLTEEEIEKACQLSMEAGADFVKTSTGFGTNGATVEHIQLMRKTVGEDKGVKASGGIRNKEVAEAMVRAGANRIGASSSIAIVEGKEASQGTY